VAAAAAATAAADALVTDHAGTPRRRQPQYCEQTRVKPEHGYSLGRGSARPACASIQKRFGLGERPGSLRGPGSLFDLDGAGRVLALTIDGAVLSSHKRQKRDEAGVPSCRSDRTTSTRNRRPNED